MSYATVSDFTARLGSTFAAIYPDADGLLAAGADLEAASAEIDGAVAYRYALPIAGTASLALLKDWTLTLAEERAYARCIGGDYAEKVKSRVAQVRTYLEMVRKDEFRLPGAAEKSASGGTIALIQNETPVFGRNNMGGF